MSGPYWNTDREVPSLPREPEPRACLLCGFEATSETIWLRPAWWREPLDGKWITTIPRCLDIDACRRRVEALGEPWPLLEAGEEPRSHGVATVSAPTSRRDDGSAAPQPMDPPLPTPPDAEPEEAPDDRYF